MWVEDIAASIFVKHGITWVETKRERGTIEESLFVLNENDISNSGGDFVKMGNFLTHELKWVSNKKPLQRLGGSEPSLE